jgi:uncharacterized delta-60 repeat protein
MVIGAVAFSYAYFTRQYVPLQVAASVFFVEFLVRVTVGLRYSPIGVLARGMTLGQPPEWVSAKPKRFAWSLGLAMALAMTVITNVGIRGWLPRTMCLICLALMWMESALGLCLGCKIYGRLLARGWIGADPEIEVCADGSCEPRPARSPARVGATGIMLALSVGALLVAAGSAVAAGRLDTRPLRSWSVLKMDQTRETKVAGGRQRGGLLKKTVDIGPAAFILEPILAPARAIADVLSTADGTDYHVLAQAPVKNPADPQSAMGAVTHLDEYQTYLKRSGEASLSVTLSRIVLDAVDQNGIESVTECGAPDGLCYPIEALVVFHLRAYTTGRTGREFFAAGGMASLQGSATEGWDFEAATAADANVAQWNRDNFNRLVDLGVTDEPQGQMHLKAPRTLDVPLFSVGNGRPFTVHVSLQAEAVTDRGRESAAEAFIEDPQHRDPPLLSTQGLQALGTQQVKEPAAKPLPAARCSSGPSPKSGVIELSRSSYPAGEGHGSALVIVTRTGGSRGAVSVDVSTSGGSAEAGNDFTSTSARVRFGNHDDTPRFVEIPIHQDQAAEPPETFNVSLADARCATLGQQHSATVRILDDDQPPPTPPPTFTINGTVDGLQGSGLVLSNLGDDVPVSASGSFTFPRTAVTGQPYEISVKTQPTNPDQICTIEHGAGTVSIANVTDIAVHCTTSVIPSGLDSTFGDQGRVTTPGNGDGRAVLIQPDGKMVTVGAREVGNNFHFQFGATRHDANGNLDPGFGTGGIATTPLGGNDDKARDAALLPDGGFVAVGQADPAGLGNVDFGVVRYTADGHPDPGFNSTGVETTDIAGRGDVANAVAVQADGKIVVVGEAETIPSFFDFAVVRYNPNGTLDQSFGGDGIVTTDLGSEFDDATAVAIQPDGKIVVAGDTEQNVALARYLPDGQLDPTFNAGGTVVSNIGTNEANGVAITPGGTILIAGTRVGPTGNRDPYVASYGPSGKLNLGFGNFGVAQADVSGGEDYGNDLALDANGNIVVVGSASSATTVSDMALVRFKPDGTLDTILTTDFHGTGDFGNALAIDPQGRIVAAGSSGDQFALMRANL